MKIINRFFTLIFLVITPFTINAATSEQFALAIKGGVSLGSYEAGLNWVLIEEIKHYEKNNHGQLKVFTGASAGSINTIISALNYCRLDSSSIEDNLYRAAWDVGIIDLRRHRPDKGDISENLKFYLTAETDSSSAIQTKYEGGLFSRTALLPSAKALYRAIEDAQFPLNPNCDIDIGLAVTKLIPDNYEENRIELTSQRYVFPLNVSIVNNKLVFKNIYHDGFRINRNYLLLPEKNGLVETHQVIKLALASSAFPLAFAPVNLEYCEKIHGDDISSDRICPQGYSYKNALFSDGGIFNNAPIGSAIDIFARDKQCDADSSKPCVQSEELFDQAVFGYIDPAKHRGYFNDDISNETERLQNIPQDIYISGFVDYLYLGADIMSSGILAELHDSVRRLNAIKQRRLLNNGEWANQDTDDLYPKLFTSTRFYPVVGDYLQHFGAFFDKEFRNFDFYIGVYDGIINTSRYRCLHINEPSQLPFSDCIGLYAGETSQRLNIEHQAAKNLIKTLAQREFLADTESSHWDWLETGSSDDDIYHLIYRSLDISNCPQSDYCLKPIRMPEFDQFLENLAPLKKSFEPLTQSMIENPRDWAFPLILSGLEQTREIMSHKKKQYEDYGLSDEANLQEINLKFLDFTSYGILTYSEKQKTGYWPSDTSGSEGGAVSSLIPDEFGGDINQGGIYFSYDWRLLNNQNISPWLIEARLTPYHVIHRDTSPKALASVDLSLRYHIDGAVLSSIGLGPAIYHDWEKQDEIDRLSYGGSINFGLLADKIRVSLMYRKIEGSDDMISILLGISDFRGFWDWVL